MAKQQTTLNNLVTFSDFAFDITDLLPRDIIIILLQPSKIKILLKIVKSHSSYLRKQIRNVISCSKTTCEIKVDPYAM